MTSYNCEIVDSGAFCEFIFFSISPKNLLGDFFSTVSLSIWNVWWIKNYHNAEHSLKKWRQPGKFRGWHDRLNAKYFQMKSIEKWKQKARGLKQELHALYLACKDQELHGMQRFWEFALLDMPSVR